MIRLFQYLWVEWVLGKNFKDWERKRMQERRVKMYINKYNNFW